MTLETLLTIVLTFFGTILLLLLLALPFVILYVSYKANNKIDFVIFNTHKDQTVSYVWEKGRKIIGEKGVQYVTAKFMFPNSIKRNLGSSIRDEHIHPNTNGKRFICPVAIKDLIPSPLSFNKIKKVEAESVEMDKIPESFTLTPNLQESGESYLDMLRSNQKLNEKEKDFFQRLAAVAGVTILIICIIGVIVVFVLAATLIPRFVHDLTGTTPPTQGELPPS